MSDVEPPQQAELACQSLMPPPLAKGNPHLLSAWASCSDTRVAPFLALSERTRPVVSFLSHGVEQPFSHISSSSRLMFRWKCLHKEKYQASLRIGGGFQLHSLFARGMKTAQAFILFHHLRQDAFLG